MTKVKDVGSERRLNDRESVQTLLPVSLEVEGRAQSVSACLYDVSPEGLCLILREEMPIGTTATLVTLHERITFTVAWVEKDAERVYRSGLKLAVSRPDLRDLVSSHLSPRKFA